jgi:Flp pilus assembly protein TadG
MMDSTILCAKISAESMFKKRLKLLLQIAMSHAFLKNAKGSVVVPFAIGLPVLLGVAGIAVDFAVMNVKRGQLQIAADRSAIAAAKELSLSNATTISVTAVANSLVQASANSAMSNVNVAVQVNNPDANVKVTLREDWVPFFAHFIQTGVTPLVVSATAQLAGHTNLCVLTLDPLGTKTLYMDKSARLMANDCMVYANSSHAQAIRLDQNSELHAAAICAVGGVKSKSSAISPAPTTDCSVIEDPLSLRQPVEQVGCVETNMDVSSGNYTLLPGRYCGGLKISGTATVTFRPGDYTIADGAFEISGSATVKSENAAFYLQGNSTVLKFKDSSTINMSGAKTGPMAGLLFFEDREVSDGRVHQINSSNVKELTGTIYLSKGKLRVDPNSSVAQDSAYTAVVAYQVEVDEGPTLVLNSNYSTTNVPVPEGIRVNSQIVLIK